MLIEWKSELRGMTGQTPRDDINFIIVANSQKEKQFNKIAINSGTIAFLLCARRRYNKAKRLEIKRNFVYNKITWCFKGTV
jgi:hypothetical protein